MYGTLTECEHENAKRENMYRSSGNGPDDYDEYWVQVTCKTCGKIWTEDEHYYS